MAVRWRTGAAIIAAVILAAAVAQAGPLSVRYALDRRVFKVCILLTPPNYTNVNPYFFIALQHNPLKPPGWEFENPLASPFVTQEMYNAWTNPAHAPDAGSGPNYWSRVGYQDPATAPGQPINKSWPQYWEVYYNGRMGDRLRDFDLIYISAHQVNIASAALRRALCEAVEEGAILWIDSGAHDAGGPQQMQIVNLEPPRVNAASKVPFGFAWGPAANYFRERISKHADLLLKPFSLTDEVYWLGDYPEPGQPTDCQYIDFSAATGPADQELAPIVLTRDYGSGQGYPAVAVCQYGAGRIVVSSIGIGDDVEEWMVFGWEGPDAYQSPDIKFAYNVLAWGTQWESARQASSNSGYTSASVLPPLEVKWQFPDPVRDLPTTALDDEIGPVVGTPVVSNGMVFAVTLNSQNGRPAMLLCFDADPDRDLDGDGLVDDAADLDGDGNPDPDFFDYRYGMPYDLVWAMPLQAIVGSANAVTPRFSSPTVALVTAYDTAGNPRSIPVVIVACTNLAFPAGPAPGYVAAVNALVDRSVLSVMNPPFNRTGQVVWRFTLAPWGNAQVRDVSTPVVHRGWVYVACSEVDPAVDGQPGLSADDCYGRVWCFDLRTGGDPVAGGGYWVYPDPDLNRDGVTAPADPRETECQNVLPPLQEPDWLINLPTELPPDPGCVPVVTTHTRNAEDDLTEAVVMINTPVSVRYDSASGTVKIGRSNLAAPFDPDGNANARLGGMDIALIPTPCRVVGGQPEYLLNAQFYRVYMADPIDATQNIIIERYDDTAINIGATAPVSPADPADDCYVDATNSRRLIIKPHAARYLLSAPSGSGGIADPIRLAHVVRLLVTYNGNPGPEGAWLRGIQPWRTRYDLAERRATPGAVRNRVLYATTDIPAGNQDGLRTGKVVAQDLRILARHWQFDVRGSSPAGPLDTTIRARIQSAPAAMHGTVVAAASLVPTGQALPATGEVVGLASEAQLTVQLGSYLTGSPFTAGHVGIAKGTPDGSPPVTVRLLAVPDAGGNPVVVPPWYYVVDFDNRTITFKWEVAHRIRVQAGNPPQLVTLHIYGEPIIVTWRHDNATPENPSDDGWITELQRVPGLCRFAYLPGYIKLKRYPVQLNTVQIKLVDGTPIAGWQPGEATVTYGGNVLLPHGWIDLRPAFLDYNANATQDPGEPSVPVGAIVRVSYTGFDPDTGFITIPNPALNIGEELHQLTVQFGQPSAGVSVAGTAAYVGTEGLADAAGNFTTPAGAASPAETLLSLVWEPSTNLVRGFLTRPAYIGRFATSPTDIPVATAAPSIASEGVFVGARIKSNAATPLGIGFVSNLRSSRTLICDANRIIECAGQYINWELVGTQSWHYGQGRAGQEPARMELNKPSKATLLPNGNLLVVDTGNNRVVEVDRSGNVLWPLDSNGYDYYTSPENRRLHLRRPTDAQRFYTLEDANGDGTLERVINTVIADSGNFRVLHVRSWMEWDASQNRYEWRHSVEVVTPERLRDPTDPHRRVRARYTKVAILTHPRDGSLIGYLCAAANLRMLVVVGYVDDGTGNVARMVNPPASGLLPGESGAGALTWRIWAWLYDPDLTDGVDERYDPLIFANLRDMQLRRIGDVVYLTVCCRSYQGRLSLLRQGQQPYGADPGPGVFEFRVNYDPASAGLIAPTAGGAPGYPLQDIPIWRFTFAEYQNFPFFRIRLPNGTTWQKPFRPTCAQILPNGNHLIANSVGLIERLTKAAIRQLAQTAGTTWETGIVTTSEVFEVETDDQGDGDPSNDVHRLDWRRIIPDPYGTDWPDPLLAPAYAERAG